MSIVEVIVAIFITSIAVLALLSMQPQVWRNVGKSDFMGRGAGILAAELQRNELWIMNPCNAVAAGTSSRTVRASGLGADVAGDAVYTVTTTITNIGTGTWRVTVSVNWPSSTITESVIATRQEQFRFPSGCTNA